jgi:hypothetical protein
MLCLNSKQRGDATPKFRGISGRSLVNAAPSTCLVLGRGLEGIEFQNESAECTDLISDLCTSRS